MSVTRVLYDHPMSGNCQKVHILLRHLGLSYETRAVDLEGGETRTPEFRALNPLGQVPVLDDSGTIVCDSQAILVYLAVKHGSPLTDRSAEGMAEIQRWLSFAAKEVSLGPQMTRLYHLIGKAEIDIASSEAMSAAVLHRLEAHLTLQDWLCLNRPTIADIAVFPYIALARDGHLPLDDHAAILAWLSRLRAVPGYQPLTLYPRYTAMITHLDGAYRLAE